MARNASPEISGTVVETPTEGVLTEVLPVDGHQVTPRSRRPC